MDIFDVLVYETIQKSVLKNIEEENYPKAIEALLKVLNQLYSNIPDNKRISYGRYYTIKVLSTDLYNKFKENNFPVYDISKELLMVSKNFLKNNVALFQAEAENIPFRSNTFDLIYSVRVFQYITNIEKAIKEINRILKSNGLIIIMVPNKLNIIRLLNYHTRLISPFELIKYFKKNEWKIIENHSIIFSFPQSNHNIFKNLENLI